MFINWILGLSFKKALYGLKQAGRQWFKKLNEELCEFGLKPLSCNPCVYIQKCEGKILIVAVYVDDILLMSNVVKWLNEFKQSFNAKFEIKDLGIVKNCLGMEFKFGEGFIEISQSGYVEAVLKKFGMENTKSVVTPLDLGIKLKKSNVVEASEKQTYPFRELIGSLMYLAVATRPDISFAVNYLSQFNNSNGEEHWTAAKRILRYLRGTSKLRLKYQKNSKELQGFVDSDWAGCLEDRRSYTGFVFVLSD